MIDRQVNRAHSRCGRFGEPLDPILWHEVVYHVYQKKDVKTCSRAIPFSTRVPVRCPFALSRFIPLIFLRVAKDDIEIVHFADKQHEWTLRPVGGDFQVTYATAKTF